MLHKEIIMPLNNRAFVSLSVLAEEILGLSRARTYELIERGALPFPIYDIQTRRPMFNRELQEQARQVRESGIGIDGRPIIFYRRRAPVSPTTPRSSRRRVAAIVPANGHADLIAGLQGLGITNVDAAAVGIAIREVFPNGTTTEQQADIVRSLFRHFRRRQSA
jgi:hypothetical protein